VQRVEGGGAGRLVVLVVGDERAEEIAESTCVGAK
jgi:hypothetical protein